MKAEIRSPKARRGLALLAVATLVAIVPQVHAEGGLPLWTNRFKGMANSDAYPAAIAVERGGNVVVTGRAYDSASNYGYYATIKYSGAGAPLWTNFYHEA